MIQNDILYSLYDDTINTSELADIAEARVQEQPNDLATRAHLIHYYYNRETKHAQKEVSEGRLRHIEWFIRNQPDLEFCGTAPFYVRASDPRFGAVKILWQEALADLNANMAQVNACMYLLNADSSEGQQLLDKLFPPGSNNIWVLALRDLLYDSGVCFTSTVALERSQPKVSSADCRARLLTEFKEERDWNSFALCNNDDRRSDVSEFWKSDFSSTMSLRTASRIAACSVFRFESSSILRINPEVTSVRFRLACWIIRHLPSSKLANSPIFMGPFESPKAYDFFELGHCKFFECVYDFLAELWRAQLQEFPKDRKVANNAATFAIQCERFFPSAAKVVISDLLQTKIGRAALKRP